MVALYATKDELRQPWCVASIPFINGLADRDPLCDAESDDEVEQHITEDQQKTDVTDHHQSSEVPNETCIHSSQSQNEKSVSNSDLFRELFDLRTNLALINNHIGHVPDQDVVQLFHRVKGRVSEIETLLRLKSDVGSGSDKDISCEPNLETTNTGTPVESEPNLVDVHSDVEVDHADDDVVSDHGHTTHVYAHHDSEVDLADRDGVSDHAQLNNVDVHADSHVAPDVVSQHDEPGHVDVNHVVDVDHVVLDDRPDHDVLSQQAEPTHLAAHNDVDVQPMEVDNPEFSNVCIYISISC